jgi:hypothetical protein
MKSEIIMIAKARILKKSNEIKEMVEETKIWTPTIKEIKEITARKIVTEKPIMLRI